MSSPVVPGESPPPDFGSSYGVVASVLELAKFDAALDRGALISAESRRLAFTPSRATSGEALPYGLGWFAQSTPAQTLAWHGGQFDSYSGLYVKALESGWSLIVLASSQAVAVPFNDMTGANVLISPFAAAFLRTFVLESQDLGLPSSRGGGARADGTRIFCDWSRRAARRR
ncbi:MAG: beta-lactamase family protein [Acidobacteria bacterium]|nr:beta-lactamase family protein [Acidobacteriota bacterium]